MPAVVKRNLLSRNSIVYMGLALIIAAGIYARGTELSWHFSHPDDVGVAKTILQSKQAGENNLFAVPAYWTYAPFQFLFTHFLITPGQSYREILLWGRLPSFVFGITALFALLIFYKLADGLKSFRSLTALTLLACSWESIIHAKQMHSYGIGMTGACLLFVLLAVMVKRDSFSMKIMAAAALCLAVISHMHYQLLFFMPAFFGALFFHACRRGYAKKAAAALFACGFVYLAAVAPMIYFFLRGRTGSGVYWWSSGPNDEYFYHFSPEMNLWDRALYTLDFFTENLFIVFQANTAFLPEGHLLAEPFAVLFFILFIVGSVRLFKAETPEEAAAGVFNLGSFAVWFILVALQKLTLGPTRHSLILLPFMCIAAAYGAGEVIRAFTSKDKFPRAASIVHISLSAAVLVLFLTHYGHFLESRRDIFIEKDILKLLQDYEVDEVVLPRDTAQVHVMESVQDYIVSHSGRSADPYRTVAWISRIDKINPVKLAEMEMLYNRLTMAHLEEAASKQGKEPDLSGMPFSYKVIYSKEIESRTEIDYSSKTENGSNSQFIYILRRDAAPA